MLLLDATQLRKLRAVLAKLEGEAIVLVWCLATRCYRYCVSTFLPTQRCHKLVSFSAPLSLPPPSQFFFRFTISCSCAKQGQAGQPQVQQPFQRCLLPFLCCVVLCCVVLCCVVLCCVCVFMWPLFFWRFFAFLKGVSDAFFVAFSAHLLNRVQPFPFHPHPMLSPWSSSHPATRPHRNAGRDPQAPPQHLGRRHQTETRACSTSPRPRAIRVPLMRPCTACRR